ncbi:MAG: GNAT family N-acetyltransferase, partial [Ignavibacteriae bacterium]|nr:GNAT family N-acetyltransferase [Ignavibacteriota bacterium]
MNIARTYRIETERLVVRCYEPTDAQMLLDAISVSIDHLLPWMPWAKDETTSLDDKINLIRMFRGKYDLGTDYVLGIFNKEENELLGGCGLHDRIGKDGREIGYWINANHINKGYCTEMVRALTKVGFEIENLKRIEIHCAPENIPSQSIPRKLGYTLEAVLKSRTIDAFGVL